MTRLERQLTESVLDVRAHNLYARVRKLEQGNYGPRFIRWRARHMRAELDALLALANKLGYKFDERRQQWIFPTMKERHVQRAITLRRKR